MKIVIGGALILFLIVIFLLFPKKVHTPIKIHIPYPTITLQEDRFREKGEIMGITSPSLEGMDSFDKKNTCDGDNINPSLVITFVDKGAKELLLVMNDPDAQNGEGFTHWAVNNIDPKTTQISENSIPKGAIVEKNSFGHAQYEGPCPPQGQSHRYFFTLYSLVTPVDISGKVKKADIEHALQGYEIQRADFYAWYKR